MPYILISVLCVCIFFPYTFITTSDFSFKYYQLANNKNGKKVLVSIIITAIFCPVLPHSLICILKRENESKWHQTKLNRKPTDQSQQNIQNHQSKCCFWWTLCVCVTKQQCTPPRLRLLCLYFAIDIDFICAWFVVLCMCAVCTMCACVYQKCKSCVCIRYATKWNNAYACGHRPGRVRVHSSRNWIFFCCLWRTANESRMLLIHFLVYQLQKNM